MHLLRPLVHEVVDGGADLLVEVHRQLTECPLNDLWFGFRQSFFFCELVDADCSDDLLHALPEQCKLAVILEFVQEQFFPLADLRYFDLGVVVGLGLLFIVVVFVLGEHIAVLSADTLQSRYDLTLELSYQVVQISGRATFRQHKQCRWLRLDLLYKRN